MNKDLDKERINELLAQELIAIGWFPNADRQWEKIKEAIPRIKALLSREKQ